MKKKTIATLLTLTITASMLLVGCNSNTSSAIEDTEIVAEIESTEAIETETETEMETETTETVEATETVEETETESVAETESTESDITAMSATKYAKSSVNVRKGPSADTERLGGLTTNQQVTVTGQASNGWYQIAYNGETGYVSDKYLVDTKVSETANSNSSKTATSSAASNSSSQDATAATNAASAGTYTGDSQAAAAADSGTASSNDTNSSYVDNSSASSTTSSTVIDGNDADALAAFNASIGATVVTPEEQQEMKDRTDAATGTGWDSGNLSRN